MSNNIRNDMPRRIHEADGGDNDDTGWVATRGPLAPPPSPVARSLTMLAEAAPAIKSVETAGSSSVEQSEASDRSDVRANSSDASRFLRASLADALSSSLATIAGEAHHASAADASQRVARGVPHHAQRGGSSSSSGSEARHQSSSSGRDGDMSTSGGPAVVTASGINTSSGDDRFSSGGNSGSNHGEANEGASLPYAHAETIEDRGPFLRHYQRRRPALDRSQARDWYGLPVHVDERLHRRGANNAAHAVVVARLPPPQTEATTSSSFFSSSSDRGGSGGSGGEERNATEGYLHGRLHHGRAAGMNSRVAALPRFPANDRMAKSAFSRHDGRKTNMSEAKTSPVRPAASVDVGRLGDGELKMPAHKSLPSTPLLVRKLGIRRQRSMGDGSCSSDSGDSGSGTDGGYAGSASSNDNAPQSSSCSSPSVSSAEDYQERSRGGSLLRSHRGDRGSSLSSSLGVADSTSGVSGEGRTADASFGINLASRSCSPVSSTFSSSSDGEGSFGVLEDNRTSAALAANRKSIGAPATRRIRRRRASEPVTKPRARKRPHDAESPKSRSQEKGSVTLSRPSKRRFGNELGSLRDFQSKMERATGRTLQEYQNKLGTLKTLHHKKLAQAKLKATKGELSPRIGDICGKPPIFSLGCDTMAICLSYLEPPEVHDLLTMPLSRDWYSIYTQPHDLWRILCLSEPFRAKFEADENDSSDESLCSFPLNSDLEIKHLFGRYRLLFTSFIRCMRYLTRIKDDAVNGRPPSIIDYGGAGLSSHPFTSNSSLKNFLARARGVVGRNKRQRAVGSPLSSGSNSPENVPSTGDLPLGVSDSDTSSARKRQRIAAQRQSRPTPNPKVKYGHSQITQRLLGPAKTGEAGNVNLPWSCAIYSIVNWMVAFSDVEGIQTMCLKVLPCLLEDENQRTTAQRAGLTGIVLRGMVLFPDSVELHTAAFHTIVLLARPLGGKEGMLFHSSMVNSSGIFTNGTQSGKNGIAVMLDSMRRFASEEALQAMSCWSLVNIALATSQKSVLVKLGGIAAVANSMMQHPYSAEVQFRALFALINLVIPSVNLAEETTAARSVSEQLGEVNDTTEKEMLDENVGRIANLVVLAMKNFCSSQTILNRACLVLHNLSLTHEYHSTLLWTPNCYQMLEWCLANYPNDRVLQQSAAGTLHRLQVTLSSDDALRRQFTASIQVQQQLSLEQAHREATLLHDQEELRQQQLEPRED